LVALPEFPTVQQFPSIEGKYPPWMRRALLFRNFNPNKVIRLFNLYREFITDETGEMLPHNYHVKKAFLIQTWDKVHPGFKGTLYRKALINIMADVEGYWPISLFCLNNNESYM
jgi:hypothetical protein